MLTTLSACNERNTVAQKLALLCTKFVGTTYGYKSIDAALQNFLVR